MDEFRDRVFSYLNATLERWATLKPHNATDIALDICGPDDAVDLQTIPLHLRCAWCRRRSSLAFRRSHAANWLILVSTRRRFWL
jgi:hypothetical protein